MPVSQTSWRAELDEIAQPSLRLAILLIPFVAAFSALGLFIVHGPVGRLRDLDQRVMDELVERRTELLDALTGYGTHLAETVPVLVLTILAVLAAWRLSRRLVLPAVIALAVGGEKLIYLVSSLIVGRDRPPVETVGSTYATASFPSGHVASAVTLYGSIALVAGALAGSRRWRNVLLVVAALLSAIVAFCRMYRGFHYPTDVVAGMLLGVTWLWTTWRVVTGPDERRRTRRPAPPLAHDPAPPASSATG